MVRFNKQTGACFFFVMCISLTSCALVQKVRSGNSEVAEEEAPSLLQGTVVARSNIRQAPSKASQIIKTVNPGTVVWVEEEIDDWYRLHDENDQQGYIYHSLVDLPDKTSLTVVQDESEPEETYSEPVDPEEWFDEEIAFHGKANANMRFGPGTQYDPPVGLIKRGTVFTADGRTGPWYHGNTSDASGWIHSSLLVSADQYLHQESSNSPASQKGATAERDSNASAQSAGTQASAQNSEMASMASYAGGMMKWGGEIANDMAEDMPEGSAARDTLKLGAAVYTEMGAAVEAAAAEEAANPQGDPMVSMAKIGGRAMQAGGQAASRAANDIPDSPLRDMAKVGGAAYAQAGAAVQSAAAEEAADPQGGGMGSMVKIGGRAMQAGGQAASSAADDIPDSPLRDMAKAGGAAYSQAGAAVQTAAAGDAPVKKTQTAQLKARIASDAPVMVRANPSTFAPVLNEATPGSAVTVLEQAQEWSKIRIGTTTGYVQNSELSK
jgi:uncharacterized protein YgiM (DUF1202 family)